MPPDPVRDYQAERAAEQAIDARDIEGLAGQLYTQDASRRGEAFVWWHLLRDSIKTEYRTRAIGQINEFHARNKAPWD